MCLVAFPAQGEHAAPLLILTGRLTRLLEFCDRFRGWFCSRWPPLTWLFSWRGICCKYLQVWKLCLDIFVSPSSVCLNYLEIILPSSVCLKSFGIARILFSCEMARLEFAMRVIFDFWLGSKFPFLFPFYHILSLVFVSCGRHAVSFLVLFGLIRFVGTWSFLRGPWCQVFVFFRFN